MDQSIAAKTGTLPVHSRLRRVLVRAMATRGRVWLLAVASCAVGLAGGSWLADQSQPIGHDLDLRWWWLAAGFYAAEILVVHLQFRRDAHTFSMSEIPATLGLMFVAPADLLIAQLVGAALALSVHRRQRPAKLMFNLGQLAVQTTASVALFSAITGGRVGFDGRTVAGLVAALLGALFIGHGAVLVAIRVTGGTESLYETFRVFAVSSVGTIAAALLGMQLAMALVLAPQIWWIGTMPAILIFVAYRAYISQSEDKGRVEALFDAATTLHRTPQIDRAVEAAANRVLDLVKAEAAAVILHSAADHTAYLTIVDTGGRVDRMVPRHVVDGQDLRLPATGRRQRILSRAEAGTLASITDRDDIQQAILEELTVGGEPVGLLVGINRLGDISAFGEADVRVLATLASQLSTTLENGRLSDTLDELRQLKEQLEALIESKDRLVASVSHELRTPLTGVIGLASLVRDSLTENVEPESAEMLDLIVEQGNELANIIEDLLTHARAEAGTLSLRPERFDLNAEMVTVAASHELPVPETIGPVWAFADPLRTRQIIRNLVTNARRYGGPNISIELSLGTHTVAAAVVDDGEGVPSDEAVHIFEPYRSAHDQRGQPGSVGLGLAVSRSMAHMMGGDLTYDRVDGRTRFTLSLPRLPLEVMGETDLQGILAAQ